MEIEAMRTAVMEKRRADAERHYALLVPTREVMASRLRTLERTVDGMAAEVEALQAAHSIDLDFSPSCTDGMQRGADVEADRSRRAWKCLRALVRGMMYAEVPIYARTAYVDAQRLLREVDAPDDGVEGRAKVLTIERGAT